VQILNGGNFDEFAILAMLLAGINAIPPLLFIVYCFTKGRALHAAVWLGQLIHGALFIGELLVSLVSTFATCFLVIIMSFGSVSRALTH
jgi:hypothetical protein